jgi:hypothetical protein
MGLVPSFEFMRIMRTQSHPSFLHAKLLHTRSGVANGSLSSLSLGFNQASVS